MSNRKSMNIDELDWAATEKKFAQMDKETARRIANGGSRAPTRKTAAKKTAKKAPAKKTAAKKK